MNAPPPGSLQICPVEGEPAVIEIKNRPRCRVGAILADPAEVEQLRCSLQTSTAPVDLRLQGHASPRDLSAALDRGELDMVLLDVQGCADGSTLEVCAQLREAGHPQRVLVLCDLIGESLARALAELGIEDFVHRDELLPERFFELAQRDCEARARNNPLPQRDRGSQPLSRRAAVESMCRTLSHKLMSSVTSIQEFLGIVMEQAESLDPEPREFLDIARQSCDGLRQDMSDLIAIAELEGCGIIMRPQVTSLGSLVESVVKPFYAQARRQRVELNYEVEVGLPPVMVDPSHGRRLLQILLQSVLGVLPGGTGMEVSVQQSGLFEGGTEVRIAFVGPRVASATELDQYFDLHYQVQKTTDRSEGDFGFGLHVCKELVDLHGGHISAEMETGRVSAFVFHLRGVTRAMTTPDEWNSLECDR